MRIMIFNFAYRSALPYQLVYSQNRANAIGAYAFWYGKESDILMDAFGYCAGSALAGRLWPAAC